MIFQKWNPSLGASYTILFKLNVDLCFLLVTFLVTFSIIFEKIFKKFNVIFVHIWWNFVEILSDFLKILCQLYTLSECICKSLGRELPETRLGECDSLHSCRELSIFAHDTRRQPSMTRDPLTRASWATKKAKPLQGETQAPRLHEKIQGEASVPIYIHALALPRVPSARACSRRYRDC